MLTTLIFALTLTVLVVTATIVFYKKTMYNSNQMTGIHFSIVLVVCFLTLVASPGALVTRDFIIDITDVVTIVTMFGLIAFIALLLILAAGELVKD